MDERELFHKDGTSAGIWYCGKCKHVACSAAAASECCRQYVCRRCGKETKPYWFKCDACMGIERAEKAEATWKAAEPVGDDYDGPIYIDEYDEYVFDGDLESWADLHDEADLKSLRTYACTRQTARTDASDLVEEALQEFHEEAEDDAGPIDELQAAVDAWWERYPVVTWFPDYTKKVVFSSKDEEASER